MIHTGVFKTHPITKEKYEVIKMEERDFDFSRDFESLDWDTKANFLSFLNLGFLSEANKKDVLGWWEYYRLKNEGPDY